jgi:hypothetical protein
MFLNLLVVLSIIFAVLALAENKNSLPYIVKPVNLAGTNYQNWAHLHWVWLHNGQSNQQNVTDLVKGYKSHQIPLGAVNIDSTWATYFDNFEVNTEKFPDFAELVKELHDEGLKVILW